MSVFLSLLTLYALLEKEENKQESSGVNGHRRETSARTEGALTELSQSTGVLRENSLRASERTLLMLPAQLPLHGEPCWGLISLALMRGLTTSPPPPVLSPTVCCVMALSLCRKIISTIFLLKAAILQKS